MDAILMMSAKLATLNLPQMKVFWNKGYDAIITLHEVTNKILLDDSNHIVHEVIWPRFDNSSISMKDVIVASIL